MSDELAEDIVLDDERTDDVEAPEIDFPEKLVRVRFMHSNETAVCVYPDGFDLKDKDYVVVEGKYGKDLAQIKGGVYLVSECGKPKHIKELAKVLRKASESDLEKYRSNVEREKEAFRICAQKIENRGLGMKLVSAHYLLDEPKIVFFFTADNRIDFRALVKDLVAVFRVRIELRQIGVRDEAMVIGGLGMCGRDYCCHGITDKMRTVSIKMAKDQNLSLNSMKISGACGRLLCCLAYEYDYYAEERKKYPNEGCRIMFEDKTYRVSSVDVLAGTVTITSFDGSVLTMPVSSFAFNFEKRMWHVKAEP